MTPAFLFAAMLWEPACQQLQSLAERGQIGYEALMRATDMVLQEQLQHVSIPRRFSVPMREIWAMQERLVRRGGRQAFRLLEDKRFRAAYDFLLLRADTGEASKELAEWWTRFQEVDAAEREAMVATQVPAAASGGGGEKKNAGAVVDARRAPRAAVSRLVSTMSDVTAYIGLGSNLVEPAGQALISATAPGVALPPLLPVGRRAAQNLRCAGRTSAAKAMDGRGASSPPSAGDMGPAGLAALASLPQTKG